MVAADDERTVRFLTIDDHPAIVEALGGAARARGDLEQIGGFTSVEAVPVPLRSADSLVDVVVVDLNLPGVAGFDAVDAVAGWGPPVLVFSANSSARVAATCAEHGARGFASKSVPTDRVLDAVLAVSRGERVVVGTEDAGAAVRLTPRDEDVLAALVDRTHSRDLAEHLGLSPKTVDNLIAGLYWKIGLEGADRSRAGLRDWARRNGYGDPATP
jgi:DNA-binding NarL/FixJ family response regulator